VPERLLFIVPAYNESDNILGVVGALMHHSPTANVLVVNDGSTDLTAEIARSSGATVLDLPFNLGIGGAVQSGFLYAAQNGFDIAVQFDGDGQHLASEVDNLLDPVRSGTHDVAIGTRFLGDRSFRPPVMRRLGIRIIASLNSRLTGMKVTDPTSGFRAFNRDAIELLSRDYPHDFPEPESMVTLAKNGLRMCEVPVRMEARHGGRSSITVGRSVYYMCKVLLAIAIGATRPKHLRRQRPARPVSSSTSEDSGS
jgi:glycosyltransferase involved in cell wall biosynthesis